MEQAPHLEQPPMWRGKGNSCEIFVNFATLGNFGGGACTMTWANVDGGAYNGSAQHCLLSSSLSLSRTCGLMAAVMVHLQYTRTLVKTEHDTCPVYRATVPSCACVVQESNSC
jgi:hypothetical protein